MHYVAGFVFADTRVALIRKHKPFYMAGMLNGIGGGVERGESAVQAQVRETEEESGLKTDPNEWLNFATLVTTRGDLIDFFCTSYCRDHGELTSKTAEKVAWVEIDHLPEVFAFANLAYLIPMAQAALRGSFPYKKMQLIETQPREV